MRNMKQFKGCSIVQISTIMKQNIIPHRRRFDEPTRAASALPHPKLAASKTYVLLHSCSTVAAQQTQVNMGLADKLTSNG